MNDRRNIKDSITTKETSDQGMALVLAILVLLLLMGFVALSISRTTTETIITNNDVSEAKTFSAAEAGLENTTRDFVDLFQVRLFPTTTDINLVKQKPVPGYPGFTFTRDIIKTKDSAPTILTAGSYGGLYAFRDSWEVTSLAVDNITDVKVEVKRRFFSDRVPIFQFGIFYEDDLELNRPPPFMFGGRVHTNSNFFVTAYNGAGIFLNSKVTAVGEIVNDIWKPGTALVNNVDNRGDVFVNDASGNPKELETGEASVICVNPSGPNVFASQPNLPYCSKNSSWNSQKAKFQGNLENNVSRLNLPITKLNMDLVEIVRRGKNVGDLHNLGGSIVPVSNATRDADTVARERFANKPGLRISMADSKQKLPGCANAAATQVCGVRLDGSFGSSIGYQPLAMSDSYKTTALNATRMAIDGRGIWIKVETVSFDVNQLVPQTIDITQEILSLGVTEPAPLGSDLKIKGYTSSADSRSIIKLQRFAIEGSNIPDSSSGSYTSVATIGGKSQNLVVRYRDVDSSPSSGCSSCTSMDKFAPPFPSSKAANKATKSNEDAAHLKWADIRSSGFKYAIVPFPIEMYDPREGRPNDSISNANSAFGSRNIPAAGAMSLVDIDVANLRRFLKGDFDGKFPTNTPFSNAAGRTLRSSDVPENAGWVVYFSDRRGDYDFDGEYDMEDIFPNGSLQYNEDVNNNGVLDIDFSNEAARYTTSVSRGQAATADHSYFRRGVRLINGSTLPGNYDSTTPDNTRGFTFASETGVYVRGNYNATGVGLLGGNAVTPPENYFPKDTSTHIPAAIVGDAIMILSNNWNDAKSFVDPFRSQDRVASDTVIRFAMLSGDSITGNNSISYSPSVFKQLNGGVHNFKRYMETWRNKRLNYSGSLINLFVSHNNNGFFKCCSTVYTPPIRDWTFDSTFLDPTRLPPGTPYFVAISFTGFQRVNG